MRDLSEIVKRNDDAVFDAWDRAILSGEYIRAQEIARANSDLFDKTPGYVDGPPVFYPKTRLYLRASR